MRSRLIFILLVMAALAALAPRASAAVHLTQVGSFNGPVYVTAPPGDPHRLFVVEQAGRIMEVRDGQQLPAPFVDIHRDVASGGEQGLLSMAFPPDYAISHRFYVYYTAPTTDGSPGNVITVQEMATEPGNPDAVDPAARRTILTIPHPDNTNHDGGQLQFGPDGALYAGTGDGGSENDPPGNAQNPAVKLGKLLRIDPATGATTIHALGLRNPWRFSFDGATGDLVIGDVGQDAYEEVDVEPPGTADGIDYGWRCFEGFHRTSNPCSTLTGMTSPVLEKSHSGDGFCAIVGGYVVRDPTLTGLYARYLYGDNCQPAIWSAALVAPPGRVTSDARTGLSVSGLTSFGQDSCGHLYAASGSGPVYRIDGDTFTPCSAPAPPGPAPDARPPALGLTVRHRQRVLHQGGVRLSVSCDEPCTATLRGRIAIGRARARYRLRTTTRQLAAGRRTHVKLRFARGVRRAVAAALRRYRRVVVTVSATARDAAGNQRRSSRGVRAIR